MQGSPDRQRRLCKRAIGIFGQTHQQNLVVSPQRRRTRTGSPFGRGHIGGTVARRKPVRASRPSLDRFWRQRERARVLWSEGRGGKTSFRRPLLRCKPKCLGTPAFAADANFKVSISVGMPTTANSKHKGNCSPAIVLARKIPQYQHKRNVMRRLAALSRIPL
jgi:hypothetical protein